MWSDFKLWIKRAFCKHEFHGISGSFSYLNKKGNKIEVTMQTCSKCGRIEEYEVEKF